MKLVLSALVGLLASAVATVSIAQTSSNPPAAKPEPKSVGHPAELSLRRAGSTSIDLRKLPKTKPEKHERDELEPPDVEPIELPGSVPQPAGPVVPGPSAPAPAPLKSFLGLDYATWGAGHPPDTNGDVGPTYFIETVNTSVGIYDKTTGNQVAAFTFNTLMSQGSFGNTCDTNNAGDPVVVYDTFEDRWIISDFAFTGIGNFQCFAVSKSGDPVTGGWNFYSLAITDAFGDYPKFGVWPDGLYMSANLYTTSIGTYRNPRLFALNKAQMYTGAPSVQIVTFDAPSQDFTLLPANARLQTGTPPAGAPNYFSDVFQFTNAVSIYKFHVDWNRISNSTLTGPFVSTAPTSWAVPPFNVPTPGGNSTDTLGLRTMVQNQYTTFSGIESVWFSHSVLGGAAGAVAPRYYQVHVTGGTVAATTTQAATHAPDTTVNRYMPSLAVDRAGNMALGYSASSGTLNPAIRYAGRLSADPANTLPQTETSLIEGTGSQDETTRWGDYSSMSLDPDGCTFWMSNEYYVTTSGDWQTRIGAFKLSNAGCVAVNSGAVQGTVTSLSTAAPIAGATVSLGSGRTATTNGSGAYAVNAIPTGVYPSITATAPGYTPGVTTSLLVNDGVTTTKNFFLSEPPGGGCTTDTSMADFQLGTTTNIDLATSPGDAILASTSIVDQQIIIDLKADPPPPSLGFGTGVDLAQTFTAAVTGNITQVDVALGQPAGAGTSPAIKVSIRATAGTPALPTGPDLASVTIPGVPDGSIGFYSAVFANHPSVTSGATYAIVLAPTSDPGSDLQWESLGDTYPNNGYVGSLDGGVTWLLPPQGYGSDAAFKAYVIPASGAMVSSLKDSNPGIGSVPTWSTLSWTATTPANTSLHFQAAGSNSQYGPFNFVGPDGTVNTYFTSGGALSQFNGNRYLRYRANLATTNEPATPALNDATVCYTNRPPPDLSISNTDGAPFAVAGGSVVYTITAANTNPSARTATGVTVADAFPAALTCSWTCGGFGGGTCLASGTGNIADATVTLPPSSSVTYVATCSISAAAAGSLSTTATVTQLGEANLANNTATDIDTLRASARCYVKADSTGTNAGSSWLNAYADLQSALHDSSCNEIWVARGVYKPTPYVDVSSRSVSFRMPRGVGVYGGFAGGETLLAQRDVAVGLSVLSGDIDNNDTGTNGVDADTSQIVGNNSFHVIVFDGTTAAVTASTLLDGFTITGGKADDALSAGGGVFCNGSPGACSPRLSNLAFSGNLAVFGGGALYNSGSGGNSSPSISDSTFSGNAAANGGAIYDDGSEGGTSNPSIANATFSGNSAASCGGAIYDDATDAGTSSPVIKSATFSGNSADSPNGDGSAICDFTATGVNATVLTNAIVWSNTSPELSTYSGGMTLNHVVLQENACPSGASCSTTPIGTDPHLGPLQDNGGFTRTMLPGVGSSAIDAGLDSACASAPVNALDQRGIARPLGAHCDIGAVETTRLSLTVNDGTVFGLYGKTLQYVVTLHNQSATDTVSGVNLNGETTAGLDAANTLWACTGGTCTTTQMLGPFADVATVQPNSSVIWIVNVPILQSTAPSATMTIHSSAAGAASDTDTLVIFRGTFETP